jgi:hypothetical protein
MEWAEVDSGGNEIAFHDDDETDVDSWDGMIDCVRKLQGGPVRGVVESVFVDLDVEVELENGLAWLEGAGVLQLGVGDSLCGSRIKASIAYATKVDIWLAENMTTRRLGIDNRLLARKNLPRLERALAKLEAALGAPLKAYDSDRYLDELTDGGFRVR